MKKITSPMSPEQVQKVMDENNRISVVIDFDFSDLVDNDIEGINDIAEERILQEGNLSDISYKVVGHIPPIGDEDCGGVLVQVDAVVDLEDWV